MGLGFQVVNSLCIIVVIVTPAVYPRSVEFLHFDIVIESTRDRAFSITVRVWLGFTIVGIGFQVVNSLCSAFVCTVILLLVLYADVGGRRFLV